MKPHHEIGRPENGGEKSKLFELEPVEKCALRIALMRIPEIADRINNEQHEQRGAEDLDYHFKWQSFKNVNEDVFEESPEFSQIYLNAAIEEREALKAIKKQRGNTELKCGGNHNPEDHIRAIDSLIKFFEKRLKEESN